jgi:glycosyltransferase involved in cell wall biosynthesis
MRKMNIVISTGHRKWAIGELAKNLARLIDDFDTQIIEIPQSRRQVRSLAGWFFFPRAEVSIFMQQDLLLHALQKDWERNSNSVILRYTHNNRPLECYYDALKLSNHIFVENSQIRSQMIDLGICADKITFKPHPIEWQKFDVSRNEKKIRDVIFVSNFYKRKRPDLIFQTIKSLPGLNFTIYGKNWDSWGEFPKLKSLQNFEYLEFEYEKYPAVLAQHRVFCSLSDVEGGPVPLLESITAGLAAVVTNTGYSQDIARLTKSAIVIPTSPSIEIIQNSLRLAISLPNQKFDATQFDLSSYINEIKRIVHLHTAL